MREAAYGLLTTLEAEVDVDASLGFGSLTRGLSLPLVATAIAARCNDGSWGASHAYWRQRTRDLQASWPSAVDNETFQGMICSEWRTAPGPGVAPALDAAPPFLMIHAEYDDLAPLRNAAMMLQGHGNASMVVARGLRAHGIIQRKDRPCVSAAASRFLADGVLPPGKLTNCRLSVASP